MFDNFKSDVFLVLSLLLKTVCESVNYISKNLRTIKGCKTASRQSLHQPGIELRPPEKQRFAIKAR